MHMAGLNDEDEVICLGAHARRLVAAATTLLMAGDFKVHGTDHRTMTIPEFSWATSAN